MINGDYSPGSIVRSEEISVELGYLIENDLDENLTEVLPRRQRYGTRIHKAVLEYVKPIQNSIDGVQKSGILEKISKNSRKYNIEMEIKYQDSISSGGGKVMLNIDNSKLTTILESARLHEYSEAKEQIKKGTSLNEIKKELEPEK